MLFSKRDLARIILPLMIQQVLSVTIGTIDSMMVSYAGEAAVSGVSLVNTLDTLLVLVFSSLVAGGAVVVSQSIGRKDFDDARAAAKQLLYAACGIAALLTAVVLVVRQPLLSLLFGKVEADVMASAQSYFFFVALSFPFLAAESACASLFRVMGNSLISMMVSLAMNIINVIGNTILILGCGWGAAGAAIATLLSRIIGAVIMVALIQNKKNIIFIERLFHYRPDPAVIRAILRIGVPNGIENGMFHFGKLLTQTLVSTMGTAAIAANAVANTLANYQYMAGSAFSTTMVTVVGQCVGAGEQAQAKRYSRLLVLLSYAALAAVTLFTLVFAKPIIAIYDLSAESSALAFRLIAYHSICAVLIWPVAFTLPSAFRAASDVRFPLIISMVSMWVFRVALSYVFAAESFTIFGVAVAGSAMGVMSVWVAMTIDWVFRAILFLIHYLSGKWLTYYQPRTNPQK